MLNTKNLSETIDIALSGENCPVFNFISVLKFPRIVTAKIYRYSVDCDSQICDWNSLKLASTQLIESIELIERERLCEVANYFWNEYTFFILV